MDLKSKLPAGLLRGGGSLDPFNNSKRLLKESFIFLLPPLVNLFVVGINLSGERVGIRQNPD